MKTELASKIFALLGFSAMATSCDDVYGPIMYGCPPAPEYGCPYATYVANVEVSDSNDTPIEGIRVSLTSANLTSEWPSKVDTLAVGLTDKDGRCTLSNDISDIVTVVADDIDGIQNGGKFESQNTIVQFEDGDYVGEGDGNWNIGKFAKRIEIKLNTKE